KTSGPPHRPRIPSHLTAAAPRRPRCHALLRPGGLAVVRAVGLTVVRAGGDAVVQLVGHAARRDRRRSAP
ncbi:hypothetical protein, partial [Streptomyces sp. WM6391]|uniref:hypothetical protein n=1 Tax=Streptomyces sp. WM6391 TaxID=1415559 RepID=UPI000A9C4798